MAAAKFISDLVARGRYCFSAEEAVDALGANAVATRAALRRLRQKGELAMPFKGFHVVVPPEFRNIGCLPAGTTGLSGSSAGVLQPVAFI